MLELQRCVPIAEANDRHAAYRRAIGDTPPRDFGQGLFAPDIATTCTAD